MTAKEDYAKFYDLDSSEEDEEEGEEKLRVRLVKNKKGVIPKEDSDDSSDEDSDTEDDMVGTSGGGEEIEQEDVKEVGELGPDIVAKLRDDSVDYARGEELFDLSLSSRIRPRHDLSNL